MIAASLIGKGYRSIERLRASLDPRARRLGGGFERMRRDFYDELWRRAPARVGA